MNPAIPPGFTLLSRLGVSASGQVYRAREEARQRVVALKVLAPRRSSPEGLARLAALSARARELPRACAREVFEVVFDPQQPFVVMRFAPGETLADALRRGGPTPWREARRLGRRIADALTVAHAGGLVHGALKPSNVISDERGLVLLDYGFWGLPGAAPEHLAPEQRSGEDPTPASDLYSLGLLLFEALTGRPLGSLGGALPLPSSLVPGLPPSADALLLELLESEPGRRPVSAEAVSRALADDAGFEDRRTQAWSRADRPDLRFLGEPTATLSGAGAPRVFAETISLGSEAGPRVEAGADPNATIIDRRAGRGAVRPPAADPAATLTGAGLCCAPPPAAVGASPSTQAARSAGTGSWRRGPGLVALGLGAALALRLFIDVIRLIS